MDSIFLDGSKYFLRYLYEYSNNESSIVIVLELQSFWDVEFTTIRTYKVGFLFRLKIFH